VRRAAGARWRFGPDLGPNGPPWKMRAEPFVGVRPGRRGEGVDSRLDWLCWRGRCCVRVPPRWRRPPWMCSMQLLSASPSVVASFRPVRKMNGNGRMWLGWPGCAGVRCCRGCVDVAVACGLVVWWLEGDEWRRRGHTAVASSCPTQGRGRWVDSTSIRAMEVSLAVEAGAAERGWWLTGFSGFGG
jgi:hypothetical protein